MSAERVFNIFLYFDIGVASEYGVRDHRISGTDAEKKAFLLSHVSEDHPIARRFQLERNFTPEEWLAALRYGDTHFYFEEAFIILNAPSAPIYCSTAVIDGVPTVDEKIGPGAYRGDAVSEMEGRGAVPDYLVHYTNGNSFHFTELIHDDYFKAIKTLFNAKLYVSCAKLLMSCVDSLSFVEYGNKSGNFSKWLDTYADLSSCGITPEELWEFRNSLLHMTNLASKKVIAGTVSSIMPYVGGPDTMPQIRPELPKPFNLYTLITVLGAAIGKWGETYNSDRDKMLRFIERYDTTISDSRMAFFRYQSRTE
jgi:hypothetical protein